MLLELSLQYNLSPDHDENWLKKCNLTLAIGPTCHISNTFFICQHEFFLECSQLQVQTMDM